MLPASFNSPSSVGQKSPDLPCKNTAQEHNKPPLMLPTSSKAPSSASQTSLVLPCENTSQDQSDGMENIPPVVWSGSVGSLSVNSSGSIDSYAAAGFAFPGRLHKMLRDAEEEGLSHIVSWQPLGRGFVVHKPIEFVRDILHNHFNQSKLTSFQRQLNLYGFSRVKSGPDRGSYHHPLFLRDCPGLCRSIDRQRVNKGNSSRRGSRDPRFDEMAPCLEADSCASSRAPTVVSQINTRTLSKVQYSVLGTTNCAWNPQNAKSGNFVSIPKGKGESPTRKLYMSNDLPKKFLKKSIPELEPEPIPFALASVMDIMDRDATALDKDLLSFLASFVREA